MNFEYTAVYWNFHCSENKNGLKWPVWSRWNRRSEGLNYTYVCVGLHVRMCGFARTLVSADTYARVGRYVRTCFFKAFFTFGHGSFWGENIIFRAKKILNPE